MKKMVKLPVASNRFSPSKGMLLISEPYLFDPNFNRTIVLITEHNSDGSLGFILNKELDLDIADIIDIDFRISIPVYYGGPVQNNTLHFIHREPSISKDAVALGNGLYWGGDFKLIEQLVEAGNFDLANFRFFLGYSGWGIGQLLDEIKEKSWFVIPQKQDVIFSNDFSSIWKNTMNEMGKEFRILSNSPKNPHWN